MSWSVIFAKHMASHTGPEWRLRRATFSASSPFATLDRYSQDIRFYIAGSPDSSDMRTCGWSRYALLHLLRHVARDMKSALRVRQRFPSRLLKPLPTHTQGFDYTPTRTDKIGRSFPAIGRIFSGSIERQPPFAVSIVSCATMNSDLPSAELWVWSPHDAREGSWALHYMGLIYLCGTPRCEDEARG